MAILENFCFEKQDWRSGSVWIRTGIYLSSSFRIEVLKLHTSFEKGELRYSIIKKCRFSHFSLFSQEKNSKFFSIVKGVKSHSKIDGDITF
jgi:hypothetical protein